MAEAARLPRLGLAVLLAAASGTAAPLGGPPFDVDAKTPHEITFTIDTQPARDVLALLSGAPQPTLALRRLKASAHAAAAIRSQGQSPDDYFGKLVASISGTPDPLFTSFTGRSPYFSSLLDEMDASGAAGAALEAKRVASVLPTAVPTKAHVVLVPFFSISGFGEIASAAAEGEIVLAADLPRLSGDIATAPAPREVLLKVLRSASAEAWRSFFAPMKGPGWAGEKALDFDGFLARTAAEGVPTLFLVPDEFFPLSPLLEEPIARAFVRWNRAAELLLEGKMKEDRRQELFQVAGRGDFWQRYPAVVGAQMTDGLLRLAGREKFLAALAAGPRAVAALYVEVTKGKGYPPISKPVTKALEARRPDAAERRSD